MARRRKMDPERKAFISSLLEHYRKRQIASTLTFLGGCFVATDI